jgi:hypothetical protein
MPSTAASRKRKARAPESPETAPARRSRAERESQKQAAREWAAAQVSHTRPETSAADKNEEVLQSPPKKRRLTPVVSATTSTNRKAPPSEVSKKAPAASQASETLSTSRTEAPTTPPPVKLSAVEQRARAARYMQQQSSQSPKPPPNVASEASRAPAATPPRPRTTTKAASTHVTKPVFGSPVPTSRQRHGDAARNRRRSEETRVDSLPLDEVVKTTLHTRSQANEDEISLPSDDNIDEESFLDSDEEDEDYEDDDDDEAEQEELAQARARERRLQVANDASRRGLCGSLLGVLLVIVSSMALASVFESGLSLETLAEWWSPIEPTQPCFLDTFPPGPEDDVPDLPPHCTANRQPCPDGGFCRDGHLQRCQSKYEQVSDHGDACILSADTNQTIANMVDLLRSWTIDYYCGLGDDRAQDLHLREDPTTGRPLFHYSRVTGELEQGYDWNLVKTANAKDPQIFITTAVDADLFIGLHPDQPASRPLICVAKQWFVFGLGLMGTFVYSLGEFCLMFYYGRLRAAPAATVIVSVTGWLLVIFISRWQRRREAERQILLDVVTIRQAAFDRLSSAPGTALSALQLRDQLMWEHFQTSRQGRERLVKRIWPQIVHDVRQDNRVRKSLGVRDGKQDLVWTWIATTTKSPATTEDRRVAPTAVRFG